MSKSSKKKHIGGVYALSIPQERVVYLQYVNEHDKPPYFGSLIRVLPGVYRHACVDVAELCRGPEAYIAFFILDAATKSGAAKFIEICDVDQRFREWPVMKKVTKSLVSDKQTWFVIRDLTNAESFGSDLPEEYKSLPLLEYVTPQEIVERALGGVVAHRDEHASGNIQKVSMSEEEAVIISIRLADDDGEMQERLDAMHELEDLLSEAVTASSTGEFDGTEYCEGIYVIYLYGPSADELFSHCEDLLRASPFWRKTRVLIRYGPAGDDTMPSKTVDGGAD